MCGIEFCRFSVIGVGVAVVAAAGILGSATLAQQRQTTPPTSPVRHVAVLEVKDISMEQAMQAVHAAMAKAAEIDTKMDIAVVDAGGNLKAFIRMDGAWLGSIDIAIKKAKTSRYFDFPTGEIGKLSQPGGPLYGIEHSNDGLITFPGGVPIKASDGTVIGAIGVSGSTVENDHIVATAGAEAVN